MKIAVLFLAIIISIWDGVSQTIKINEPVRFLALGDSYTIGQSVGVNERWPNQFVSELGYRRFNVAELRIIAQTGWRTDNLQNAINQQAPLNGYNLVSLLIGVNNQYQGGSLQTYTGEFKELLEQAIVLAGNNPQHVFVLSIPDYAYTPYGNGNPAISEAIDEFNAANRFITETLNVKYIDITPISRNGLSQPSLVAADGLHPSGLMYDLWVDEILKYIEKETGFSESDPLNGILKMSTSGRQLILNPMQSSIDFRMFNITGNMLVHGHVSQNVNYVINLDEMPNGVYIFKIIDNNNRVMNYKIGIND